MMTNRNKSKTKTAVCTLFSVLSIIFVGSFSVNAQQHSAIQEIDITMGSPEATELAKHGNLEVDMTKGVPGVSVPLHTIQLRGFNLPIFLSYDAGGVKVDQIATNVGLGWSLQAGGQISANAHSLSDFEADRDEPNDLETFNPNTYAGGLASPDDDYTFAWEIFDTDYLGVKKNLKPDMFFYNYAGKSGKFVTNGKIEEGVQTYSIPYENHDIGYLNDAFRIKDENGNLFIFGELETTITLKDDSRCYGGTDGTTLYPPFNDDWMGDRAYTWHLSEVITADNDTLVFEYDTLESYTYDAQEIHQVFDYDTSSTGVSCNQSIADYKCIIEKTVEQKVLKSINHFRSGTAVNFIYENEREDYGDSTYKSLDSIIVKKHGNTIKNFSLDHSYFVSGSIPNSPDSLLYKRLRLDKVTQDGLPPYSFSYNSDFMPERGSYSQDYWGFYNGQYNSTGLVPNWIYLTGEADREVYTDYVDSWSMESITYPTGGKTILNMEADPSGGGLRVDSIYDIDGMGDTTGTRYYTFERFDHFGHNFYDLIKFPDANGDTLCVYDLYTSSSNQPVTTYESPDYMYDKITIDYELNGTKGRTVTTLSSQLEDLHENFSSQSIHAGAAYWGLGEILEEIHYKYDNGSFVPVQKTENTYKVFRTDASSIWDSPTRANEEIVYGLDIKMRNAESMIGVGVVPARFEVSKFHLVSAWYHPDSVKVTVFDPSDSTSALVTYTKQVFDTTSTMLSELIETNSDGSVKITRFEYAEDKISGFNKSSSALFSVSLLNDQDEILSKRTQVWDNSLGSGRWEKHKIYEKSSASDSILVQQINAYDSYGNALEIEDAAGTKTAYDWSEDGFSPIGIFQNADKDEVFAHSFALDSLDGWTFIDENNDGDTEVSVFEHKLLLKNYASAANYENDRIYYDLGSEITGKSVFEFDLKIPNSNEKDLRIGAGGSEMTNGLGGNERALVSAINNESWQVWRGYSPWVTIETGLTIGKTYSFKIVFDADNDEADFYLDGVKVKSDVSFRDTSTGIQTIVFGNFGVGSLTTEWLIDNVRIYPEEAEAISQEVDPVFRTPLAIKDVAGNTNRFLFDDLGRLNEAFNPNGERVSRNVYFYSLDDHTSFDDEDPNRIENITYNDPADTTDKTISISYLDGLGRPVQSQTRAADGTAIVTGTLYDEYGRPHITSRPIELDVSSYTNGFVDDLWGTGFNGDAGEALPTDSEIYLYYDSGFSGTTDAKYAYTQTEFEDSPLSRTIGSGNAASALRLGQNQSVMEYGLNSSSEGFSGFTANELSKTVSTDPNGNHTFSFTDGWGNTIASMVDMDGDSTKDSGDLTTEFQYDLRNQLKKVTAPEGDTTTYKYNQRGQLIEKDMPDKDYSDEYRYDDRGNLRFTKHANHKADDQSESESLSGGTSVTKTIVADDSGVLSFNFSWVDLYLGNYTITIKRTENDSTIYSNTLTAEFGSISTQTFEVPAGTYEFKGLAQDPGDIVVTGGSFDFDSERFMYTKYDELNRPIETGEYFGDVLFEDANANSETFPATYERTDIKYFYGEAEAYSKVGADTANNTKGKLVKSQYLDYNTDEWGTTWYSYNNQGLVEWIIQDLPGSTLGEKKIEYRYDELGRVIEMDYQPGESDDYYFRYSYDELGRLAKTESRNSSGGSWVENAEYTYFADGQLSDLQLGNGIENIDYIYGSEGWLTSINDPASLGGDEFGQSLTYDFAGNIDTLSWNQDMNPGQKTYYFTYDDAYRLTDANQSSGNAWDVSYDYNKNGVITEVQRRNQSGSLTGDYEMDIVANSNRLDIITDWYILEQVDVDYDANGNMIENGLFPTQLQSATYDSRNLPYTLTANSSTVYYTYDADGQRVSKKSGSTTTSYIRGADGQTIAVYENGTIDKWNLISGGDIVGTAENGSAFIEYFVKDHLGSTRTVVNSISNNIAYFDFYPFGKLMPGRHTTSNDDRYKFTGHELDSDAGIDLSYAGARYLDSEIGSWLSIDPMVDKYPGLSPYNYTMNNPINALDPTGNAVIFINGFPFDGKTKESYWGSFAEDLMKRFPNERNYFFDGGKIIKPNDNTSSVSSWSFSGRLGSTVSSGMYYGSGNFNVRRKAGYIDGQKRAKEIINNLSRDDEGNITESIKIVTHSMGAAYSRGLIEALKEYATKNKIEGLNIDFIIDIAAFQGDDISNSYIKSFQVGSPFDLLAGNRKIDGSKRIDGSSRLLPGHSLSNYSANRIIDNIISWARANDIPITIRE